eukprot:GHVU01167703.1.p1 GENE.GHVU01167703.1~~GHVU01167703.1.p1  ORF type:complete len:151 (+),score=21.40 GHVU01167703.1:2-454(+)
MLEIIGGFEGGEPIDFSVLRKLQLEGNGASGWFATTAMSCASTLEELQIEERARNFVARPRGHFSVLRTVDVNGLDTSGWFASFAESCSATLEDLTVTDNDQFVHQFPGNFAKLRELNLRGVGAHRCHVTVPETCVQRRSGVSELAGLYR